MAKTALAATLVAVVRQRRVLARLVLVLSCWCAVEAVASHLGPPPPAGLYREHPRRFWTLNGPGWCEDHHGPGPVYINSLGLRGDEPGEKRPPLVVLLLGDSCVYGYGLADGDTLPRQLERVLQRTTGADVRVHNGGCPGYSTHQGLDLLREVGGTLRPDVVVIAYYIHDGGQESVSDADRLGGRWAGMVRTALWRSPVYTLLRGRFRLGDDLYEPFLLSTRGHLPLVSRVPEAEFRGNLRAMARLARAQGARHVLFAFLPQRDFAPAHPPAAPPQGHSGMLFTVGAQEGFMVDGERMFQGEPARGDLFLDSLHLNERGCRKCADFLGAELVRLGVVRQKDL